MGRVQPVDSPGSPFSKPIPKRFSIAKQKSSTITSTRCGVCHFATDRRTSNWNKDLAVRVRSSVTSCQQ